MNADSEPECFVDGEGRFLKPYQDGPRAIREEQFYLACASALDPNLPQCHAAYPSPSGLEPIDGAKSSESYSKAPRKEDVLGLSPFLPRFHGTVEVEGRRFLALDDFCHDYRHPCLIDIKMGFTTIYPWATDAYKAKNKCKDASTTQSLLGFRISGFQVWRLSEEGEGEGSYFRSGRALGRTLTADSISTVLKDFTSGNRLSYHDVFLDESKGAIVQLRWFREWAAHQASFQFYQSSILVIYEGEARSPEEASIQVRFIDFAHCFRTLNNDRDNNLLKSIDSLIEWILSLRKESP
jgi:hypothetical protein